VEDEPSLPFYDNFSAERYGWPYGTVAGDYMDIARSLAGGVYRWDGSAHENSYSIAWPDLVVSGRFTITVDARHIDNDLDDSGIGVAFTNDEGTRFYVFRLNNNYYSVYFVDPQAGWVEIIPWNTSSVIRPGEFNTIRIVVDNDDYEYYINETRVTWFTDDRMDAGSPALFAEIFSGGASASFEFDNFSVTSP
jgi:hypothetical protein